MSTLFSTNHATDQSHHTTSPLIPQSTPPYCQATAADSLSRYTARGAPPQRGDRWVAPAHALWPGSDGAIRPRANPPRGDHHQWAGPRDRQHCAPGLRGGGRHDDRCTGQWPAADLSGQSYCACGRYRGQGWGSGLRALGRRWLPLW